jgi:methyl-accepting chemotaxis protein
MIRRIFNSSALIGALANCFVFFTIFLLFAFPLLPESERISRLIAVILISLISGTVVGTIIHNLRYLSVDRLIESYIATLEQVAKGDLTARIRNGESLTTAENEILLKLANTINATLDRLQTIVLEINKALIRLETDTQEILKSTERQILMANEQESAVTETTATVNEIRATVAETAERAQTVANSAQVSAATAKNGSSAVQETVKGMDLIRTRVENIADNILVLSEHTQQIGEIIATVNSLADQSRMLALNASVEAARAGEDGKGFAVVALEVRNLADQNREATVQVREILGEIQRATHSAVMVTEEGNKGVDAGQTLVNKAGESIRELAKAIDDAAIAALQIAASTRQQTIGMDQLTQAMRTIKHVTTENVSNTMQVETSVQRLREAAQRVSTMLRELKV